MNRAQWAEIIKQANKDGLHAAELARRMRVSGAAVVMAQKRCGVFLARKDTGGKRGRYAANAAFERAIIEALKQGPGTPREIDERMGVFPASRTTELLRDMERRGLVALCGRKKLPRGGRANIWTLVEAKAERAA